MGNFIVILLGLLFLTISFLKPVFVLIYIYNNL